MLMRISSRFIVFFIVFFMFLFFILKPLFIIRVKIRAQSR